MHLLCAPFLTAATHYVDASSAAPLSPYTNWATAAATIQAAVDVAGPGEVVLVTNGVYDSGGRAVSGTMTNRVAVGNGITVRSVNGADVTIIKGKGPMGPGAVRCAYLADGTRLEGFTLTEGHTHTTGWTVSDGGGVRSEGGIVSNCIIVGNRAGEGGGVSGGGIYNSVIVSNTASRGGGASIAPRMGGGYTYPVLYNCFVGGNTAAPYDGGGAYGATIHNCTLTHNKAARYGGGTRDCSVENSIAYYNTAALVVDNCSGGGVSHTCTTPHPGGTGNITAVPGLLGPDNPHIVAFSACVDKGTNRGWMVSAVDVDGDVRISGTSVDMGCDEIVAGGVTGDMSVTFSIAGTNIAVGCDVPFEAMIHGRADGYEWDFGDGRSVSNLSIVSHTYHAPGDYEAVLTAWNRGGRSSVTVTVHVVGGYTNYVSPSGNHTWPYTNWLTAATNIQAAIDANPVAGGVVLVTNGVYDTGATVTPGYGLSNRVVITNNAIVRSVNGPDVTLIIGAGPLGDDAVRCAYVGAKSVLDGFTLTNGYTRTDGNNVRDRSGGGVLCGSGGTVTNCRIAGCTAYHSGGGVYGGTVLSSTIIGNSLSSSSGYGGGTCQSAVRNCVVEGNTAGSGGGTAYGTIVDSEVTGNSSTEWEFGGGGGSYHSVLTNCTVTGNSALARGGGTLECTVDRSVIAGNTADVGGGVAQGLIGNSAISRNSARSSGGGVYHATVRNCTIAANHSVREAGGVAGGTVVNSIVYHNSSDVASDDNWKEGTWSHSCSHPLPPGVGCITNTPQLTGLVRPHILPTSPCVNGGTNESWVLSHRDIDGEDRVGGVVVDMGCDECHIGSLTGTLEVAVETDALQVVAGFPAVFRADIRSGVCDYWWDWGDGRPVVSNAWRAEHVYDAAGTYAVVLTARNEARVASSTVTLSVVEGHTTYVSLAGAHVWPYTNWTDAATNIQDAVDANRVAGGVVLVTNGVYGSGSRTIADGVASRVAVTNVLTLRSVNGPDATVIAGKGPAGDDAVRCVFVSGGAEVSGFTLTNGFTRTSGGRESDSGGGVWCQGGATVSNCAIVGCRAYVYGGGAYVYKGTIRNCTISGSTAGAGGGVYCEQGRVHGCVLRRNRAGGTNTGGGGARCEAGSHVRNCLIAENSAGSGGGVECRADGLVESCTVVSNTASWYGGGVICSWGGKVRNSIVYYNAADRKGDNWYNQGTGGDYAHVCTVPMLPGVRNQRGEPEFLDLSVPDCRLLPGSPCIDAASNSAWMASCGDIASNDRVIGTAPDLGCYEFTGTQLLCNVLADNPSGTLPFVCTLRAYTSGDTPRDFLYFMWDFDNDGSVDLEGYGLAVATNVYTSPGRHSVSLSVSNSAGAVFSIAKRDYLLTGPPRVHVCIAGSHTFPYTNWATAATNLQAAVDIGADGTVVLVTNGWYRLPSQVHVRTGVRIQSVNGASETAIDGARRCRCFYVDCPDAEIDGFTLTGGSVEEGGAVLLWGGGTVENCIIVTNAGWERGGGVYCFYGGVVRGCTIADNTGQPYGHGGGVYCYGGGLVERCRILRNAVGGSGGGFAFFHGGVLRSSLLQGNTANYGGGVSGHGACSIDNCTVVGNSVVYSGGGFEWHTGARVRVRNTIVYGNGAGKWGPNYHHVGAAAPAYTYAYCCSSPRPPGDGNRDQNPEFEDAASGDYRLKLSSPCVDTGINYEGALDTFDLAGNPRVLNGLPDIGAFEIAFRTGLRVFLAGAYDPTARAMTTRLSELGFVPRVSPYAADLSTVERLPSNAVDWVLVEMRETPDGSPVMSQSAFLRNDGYVLDSAGELGIVVGTTPGTTLHPVVKHRNHLCVVSSIPVAFTNRSIAYDFSANWAASHGGSNACIRLAPGVSGMIAGDANGDGLVTRSDTDICQALQGRTGYTCADFNLDGIVDGRD